MEEENNYGPDDFLHSDFDRDLRGLFHAGRPFLDGYARAGLLVSVPQVTAAESGLRLES